MHSNHSAPHSFLLIMILNTMLYGAAMLFKVQKSILLIKFKEGVLEDKIFCGAVHMAGKYVLHYRGG